MKLRTAYVALNVDLFIVHCWKRYEQQTTHRGCCDMCNSSMKKLHVRCRKINLNVSYIMMPSITDAFALTRFAACEWCQEYTSARNMNYSFAAGISTAESGIGSMTVLCDCKLAVRLQKRGIIVLYSTHRAYGSGSKAVC